MAAAAVASVAALLVVGLRAPAESSATAAPVAAVADLAPIDAVASPSPVQDRQPLLLSAAWPRAVPARDPVVVTDLALHADAAFLGYYDAGAELRADGSWTLALDSVRAADRASLGALALGVPFSRVGSASTILIGESPIVATPIDENGAALRARLGAVAEVEAGRVARPGRLGVDETVVVAITADASAAARIASVAAGLGLEPRGVALADGRHAVTLPAAHDRWVFAGLPQACCQPEMEPWRQGFDRPDLGAWRVASTGPLASFSRDEPSTKAGGVSWTNGEAQVYRPAQTTVVDGALRLRAQLSPVVSVDTTPFVSGMVVSARRFGWGRIEIDAAIPHGAGLWPALWLLPVAACEAPGRCPGYESGDYVEIDLLETIGHEAGRWHTSAHWVDAGLRSTSKVHPLPIDDGAVRTFALDWRPGVVRFELDGELVWSVPTAVDAGSSLARPPDHRLVMNLAVGGSFAGDRLLGPSSPWWGDTRVPAAFPDLDWERADLMIHEVRHTPMG